MEELYLWILFFLNPLISLFYFIFIKKKKNNIVYIALFFAFLGAVTIPKKSYDLVRYYERYDNFKIENFIYFLKGQLDFFFPTFIYFLKKLGLKKEFIPFVANFITYFFSFKIFKEIFKKNKNKKKEFIGLLIILLCIDFRGSIFGVRNIPAIMIALYSFYKFSTNKSYKYILICLIANLVHIMTLPYTLMLVLLFILSDNISFKVAKILFLISFLGVFISPELIKKFIDLLELPLKYKNHIDFYIIGYWSKEYLKDMNFNSLVYGYLINLKNIIVYIYIFDTLKNKVNNRFFTLSLLSLALSNFLYNLPNMRGRYFTLPFYMIIFLFLKEINQNKIKKQNIFVVLIFCLIFFLANLYEIRNSLLFSIVNYIQPILSFIFVDIPYKEYL